MKPDLTQVSTWRGFIGLLTVIGIVINPHLLDQAAIFLAAGFSLIEIYRDERQ